MRLFHFILDNPITWRIEPDDPALIPLAPRSDWTLVNPALDGPLQDEGVGVNEAFRQVAWLNASAVLESRHITLATDDDRANPHGLDFRDFVERLLGRLRLVSRQATIPTRFIGITNPAKSLARLPARPEPMPGLNFEQFAVQWAVTRSALTTAAATVDEPIPVSYGILLDAVAAAAAHDYRRVILYSAIASESMAASTLDSEYAIQQAAAQPNLGLRFHTYQINAGETQTKDAVFVALRQRAKFAELLHEVSLYLNRRSLLHDNQTAYQSAMKLYATRNKLTHLGEQPPDDKHLPSTRAGAIDGLETAFEIFKWFGDPGPHVNPLRRLIDTVF